MDVRNNQQEQRFEILLPDGALAYAEYRPMKGKVMFPHTVVPQQHEGKGIGSALAAAALDWAREQDLKVIPACTFFVGYMRRHPETQDLLEPAFRQQVSG